MHGSSEDQSPAGEIRSEPGPSGLLQVLQLSRSSTPQGSGFLAEANPHPLALNEPKQVASGNPQRDAEETELGDLVNDEFTCGADALRAQLSPRRMGIDAAADIHFQPSLEASAHDLANKVSHTPEMRVVHQGPPPESSVPVVQLSNMSRLLAGSEGAASCKKSGDENQEANSSGHDSSADAENSENSATHVPNRDFLLQTKARNDFASVRVTMVDGEEGARRPDARQGKLEILAGLDEDASAPYASQFAPEGHDAGLVGHMSAIPEYLRRFFSDALRVVVPMSSNQVAPGIPPMVDPQEDPGIGNAQKSRMSFDPGRGQAEAQPVDLGGDMDEALNPAQTQCQEPSPEAEQDRSGKNAATSAGNAEAGFRARTMDVERTAGAAPGMPKPALKHQDSPWRKKKRHVRFKGMVSPAYANLIAKCVQYTRAGSIGAAWWEAAMALVVTLDFFIVPVAVVSKAYVSAIQQARPEEKIGYFKFTYLLSGLDAIFTLDSLFRLSQAYVWDLGFQDMPVDKIVDASVQTIASRDRDVKGSGTQADDLMRVTMEALSNRPPGSSMGPRVKQEVYRQIPLELLAMLPMLGTWVVGLSVRIQAFTKILRIIRVRRLFWYFTQKQEDLSADVRYIAACKFVFTIFATAHWIGNIMFFFAADGDFSEEKYKVNWVSSWVQQETVAFNWKESTYAQTYVIILFKGFSMITNLAYEEAVPQVLNEVYIGLIAQNLKVVIDAYILGTLFHYLVKKDPADEASEELMRALHVYCEERHLPDVLHTQMQAYLRFQQQHATSVTDHVIRLLPASLQTRLADDHCNEAIRRNMHLFAGCDIQFRLRFMMHLQDVYLMPGESVLKQDEIARELNFVTKGTLVVTDANDVLIELKTGEGTASSVVGEVSFLMGVSEPYSVRARENEDTAVLAISKTAFNGIIASYPEQNDIIMTNMLSQYGLTRDGVDTGGGAAVQGDDEASAKLREDIMKALKRTQDAALERLTVAATEGDLDSVRNLLARGLPINKADYNGSTTLHLAVSENRTEIVAALLDKGAKSEVSDTWKNTPLSDALTNFRVDIAAILISKGARMANPSQFSLVMDAAAKEWTLLTLMCIKGGVDANSADYDSRSVMHVAASTGNLRVVQGLLQVGANVNIRDRWGFQPLDDAVKSNDPILFHLLVGNGGKLSEEFQRHAILNACRSGSIRIINLLGESSADLNACNYDQMTGIHMAARGGNLLVLARMASLQFLDINKIDTWGYTPLDHAVDQKQWPCAVLLLSMGGEMRQRNSQATLAEAVAAQQLPKLGVVRTAARAAFVSLDPELYEMSSAMGSRSNSVLNSRENTARGMLLVCMKDVAGIRVTVEKLLTTLDEINTISFVLLRVLVVTAPKKKQGLKKVVSNNGRSGADSGNANHDAQISKGLMNVFMKAAQFEAAMTDLITVAHKACTSAETEEQQLTALLKALGTTYDVDKAADVGGTPCFSGPEGHRKISVISLMATEYFRTLLQTGAHGGCADPRRAMGAGLTALQNSEASDSEDNEQDQDDEQKDQGTDGPSICKALEKCHATIDFTFAALDLEGHDHIDLADNGPVIYKVMLKLGLSRLWESLNSVDETAQKVSRDEFTKVYLAWLGITEHYEMSATNQDAPVSEGGGDDVDSDLLDLDEAANEAGGGSGDEEGNESGDELEEFGLDLDFGPKPLARILSLTLLENFKWLAGFPLSAAEIAHRIMNTIDTEGTGSLPVSAIDFILKQVQGELPLSKETFDLAEKIKAEKRAEGSQLLEKDIVILMQSVRINAIDTTLPDDASRYVLHPEAYVLRNFWDPLIRLLAILFFLEVPFAISFHPEHSVGDKYVFVTDYLGVIPMLDIGVTFFRAYFLANGTLIYDLQAIRLHYTSSRLLLDLMAFFPLDVIMTIYAAHHHPYVGFLRLPRMLSLYTVWYKRGYSFSFGPGASMSASILRLLGITAVITHMFACVWWYIGSHHMLDVHHHEVVGFEPHDDPHEKELHWIYYYQGLGRSQIADFHHANVAIQYLFTYYWCASTLSTAGRIGEVTPKNSSELAFTILSMLFTSVFYGYVMGEITNLVMSNDDALVQKRQKFGLVQTFLSKRRLKRDLAKDIVEVFYEKVNSQQNTDMVFDSLSSSLQVEVAMHISLPLVKSNNVFGGCSSGFTASLSVLMREMAFTGDETIFHTNDVCNELFLIAKNTVKIMVVKEGQQTVQETRGKGQLLGEASFFFQLRHINTAVVAEGSTMLFVLSYDDYQQLSSAYVSDAAAVMDIIIDLVNDSGKAGKSQGSASSGAQENQEVSEANKVRSKIMDAVRRQSEQMVVAFLKAAANNDRNTVDHILDEGSIEVDDSDGASRTALHLAAANGHLHLVSRLVTKHAASPTIKDKNGSTPIDDAIRHKHKSVVEFLATQSIATDINSDAYVEQFIQAAADNNVEDLELLHTAGIDCNCADYDGRTALHLAVSNGSKDALLALLKMEGIKVNANDTFDHTPLWDAIDRMDKEAAIILRKHGATVQDGVADILCEQAKLNNVNLFELLHSVECDIYCRNPYARTPLHVAATWGCVRTCDGIVEASTDGINRVDIFGQTALDCAQAKRKDAAVAIILSKGGKSGDDPSMEQEHEDTRIFLERNATAEGKKRKLRVSQELPEFKAHVTIRAVQAALKEFMECSFVDMQIFLSTLRTAINSEGDVGASGQDSRMAQAVEGLFATFGELLEVLNRPMMQYAAMESFLVRMMGRKALATRVSQTNKVITEALKEMRDMQRRLKKGPLQIQEYGRQQLQGMLSAGPYTYLQVPNPECSATITDENASQVMVWDRACVSDCESSIRKALVEEKLQEIDQGVVPVRTNQEEMSEG